MSKQIAQLQQQLEQARRHFSGVVTSQFFPQYAKSITASTELSDSETSFFQGLDSLLRITKVAELRESVAKNHSIILYNEALSSPSFSEQLASSSTATMQASLSQLSSSTSNAEVSPLLSQSFVIDVSAGQSMDDNSKDIYCKFLFIVNLYNNILVMQQALARIQQQQIQLEAQCKAQIQSDSIKLTGLMYSYQDSIFKSTEAKEFQNELSIFNDKCKAHYEVVSARVSNFNTDSLYSLQWISQQLLAIKDHLIKAYIGYPDDRLYIRKMLFNSVWQGFIINIAATFFENPIGKTLPPQLILEDSKYSQNLAVVKAAVEIATQEQNDTLHSAYTQFEGKIDETLAKIAQQEPLVLEPLVRVKTVEVVKSAPMGWSVAMLAAGIAFGALVASNDRACSLIKGVMSQVSDTVSDLTEGMSLSRS